MNQQKSGLQRKSGIALWRQIADSIGQEISAGLADSNGKLPGELTLAERYGVNRHTVRAALAALMNEGVVDSQQGRGTFVRRRNKLSYPISSQTRFSTGLAGQADARRLQLVEFKMVASTTTISEELEIPVKTPVMQIDTVGFADDVAVSRMRAFFHIDRMEELPEKIRQNGSISKALSEVGIPSYRRLSTVIMATHADDKDMELMSLSPGAIMLVATSKNVDDAERPIQYSVTRFPADRVELRAENI